MRLRASTVLTLVATLFAAPPGHAQAPAPEVPYVRPGNEIGTGQSLPLSDNASNINEGTTRSAIAPRLPAPAVSESAPPAAFLQAARQALAAGRTGEAQEALERAESRALDRSVRPSLARQASQAPLVQQIAHARDLLAQGDRLGTIGVIDSAMTSPEANAPNN